MALQHTMLIKATAPGPQGISSPSHALLCPVLGWSQAVTGRGDHPNTGPEFVMV